MLTIAGRLISGEHNRNDSSDTEARAAFRVCGKLGGSLSVLAGARGFRSLQARALQLAAAESPWIGKLTVAADGTVVFPPELEAQLSPREAAKGAAAVVTQLLGLLEAFIGTAMTLRLAQQVWPKVVLRDSQSNGKV